MADNNANGIEKGANGEATAPESQPGLPPVVKGPMNAGEESMVPSIADKTATGSTETAASSEPVAPNDSATIGSNKELTDKLETADKLASQPEKPADNVTEQAAPEETAKSNGPSLPNGETKELPKPVSIEEVRDQELPTPAPTQPTEVADAIAAGNPPANETKADPVKPSTETENENATIGDKRKPSDDATDNGITADEPSGEAPVEKKQKTNGDTANETPRKVGRPRKDKKAQPVVGRTARKTRSQGTAD
ncbi:hypothetical protein GGR52DRAFT_457185 [Hypoxylon sp. FL1284]|nr:hypothetical protein GGR52DRAFT_457185 [Hypoxylon sp. FL1284]